MSASGERFDPTERRQNFALLDVSYHTLVRHAPLSANSQEPEDAQHSLTCDDSRSGGKRRAAASATRAELGRERELALAEDLLRRADVGLLTLTGAGGSGKTRLALAVAARQQASFADGVAWVPLALVAAADEVLPAVARAIGVREIADEALHATLARVLSHRAVLLMLDNFEHVLAAAPLISELLLSCPGLKALVTSRAPLRVSDEHELAVLPLALPPASVRVPALNDLARIPSIQLWCQRVAAIDPSWSLATDNAPTVTEICRRLDGLPLAIELAAARVRILPPALLLERLSHRLTVLTEGPRDLPARQQTLRAAINWSYELLQPSDQKIFSQGSRLPGRFQLRGRLRCWQRRPRNRRER